MKPQKKKDQKKNAKNQMEISDKMIWVFDHLYKDGLLEQALDLVRTENWSVTKETAWKVIHLVEKHMGKGFTTNAPKNYDLSASLLCEIAAKVDAEEALGKLVYYIEDTWNDMQFVYTLMPIQVSLRKLTSSRVKWLEKCFKLIRLHLVVVHPVPGSGGDIETDWNYSVHAFELNITYVYKNVIEFYDPFLIESMLGNKNSLSKRVATAQKQKLTTFILQLLGKPFMYLDLRNHCETTLARKLAEVMVSELSKLVGDYFVYFAYAEQREKEGRYSTFIDDEFNTDTASDETTIPTAAVAHLYYLILAEGVCFEKTPCVYDPVYIWMNTVYLATCLIILDDDHGNFVATKGLLLFKKVTSRFKDLTIPHQVLEARTHKRFIGALANFDLGVKDKEIKKLVTECLRLYLYKLDWRGRYLVLFNVVLDIKEPSFVAKFTAVLFSILTEALTTTPVTPFFSGSRLFDLLSCYSQVGHEDIVEGHCQIVATLQIFCFLKTSDTGDATGFKKHDEHFKSKFFRPLVNALIRFRAEYEVRVKDLQAALKMVPRRKTLDFPKSMREWIKSGEMERETKEKIAEADEALNRFHQVDCWLNRIMVGGTVDSKSYMVQTKDVSRKSSRAGSLFFI